MKKSKWALWALAVLLLAGCSLARPEAENGVGDRWIGFFVAPTQGYERGFHDNPYLEEYGAFTAETKEFGTLSFPQDVLFAEEDEAGNYTFPGVERGYSLFVIRKEEEHGSCVSVQSDMAPGEEGLQLNYVDEDVSYVFSGTIYFGPPLGAENWDSYTDSNIIWNFYRVYQTEDGRVYLNGDGSSSKGSGAYTETETRTMTWDGESASETVQATVTVQAAPRLEKLIVTQFDAANALVRSDDLALRDDLPEIRCEAETAWALVEEVGSDGTARTLYDAPEKGADPVSHTVVLLDDEGYGYLACLNIYGR